MNHFIREINIPYARMCALYKYAHEAFFNHRNAMLFNIIILYQHRHILDVTTQMIG